MSGDPDIADHFIESLDVSRRCQWEEHTCQTNFTHSTDLPRWTWCGQQRHVLQSVPVMHHTSATRELSVYLDGQCLRHECHPTYLGVTLDHTLSTENT